MAIKLARLNWDVELIERREDPRSSMSRKNGRSINIALSTRGLHALEETGLLDDILATASPLAGRMIHPVSGRLSYQPYGITPQHVIHTISRSALHAKLLDTAEALPNVRLRFNEMVDDVDFDAARLSIRNLKTQEKQVVSADVLIGADGAFSAIRQHLVKFAQFNFSQTYLGHGFKELTVPPGTHTLDRTALHLWPRDGYMMIAQPNSDESFTCTLFGPQEGPGSLASLQTPEEVTQFFGRHFSDLVPHMPDLGNEYLRNPTNHLLTIRCAPWYYRGRVVLLGDACHALVPFLGQGANAAFEDCDVLKQSLERHAPDWEAAFAEYYGARKADVDVLADLSHKNYLELRKRTGSSVHRVSKMVEHVAHRVFPRWFSPLYCLVVFSRLPYSHAVRRAKRQTTAAAAGVVALAAILIFTLFAAVSWYMKVPANSPWGVESVRAGTRELPAPATAPPPVAPAVARSPVPLADA
jgi:kynurenine 3-monooxygenase